MNDISPLACVSPSAVIGPNTKIGPFAVVESGAVLGEGCRLEAGSVVKTGAILGDRVWVHSYAVIGGIPQDYSFDSSRKVGVRIGDDTIVREGVTVSLATKDGESTIVGKNCMLMAQSHVAHDCVLGDHVIMANCALLAGHVHVADRAFLSGGVAVHQFCRIGESVMAGGGTVLTADVPPYCMLGGRNALAGLNLVGLRRRGFSREIIAELKAAYRAVYLTKSMNLRANAEAAHASGVFKSAEAMKFLRFFEGGRRNTFVRPRKSFGGEASEE